MAETSDVASVVDAGRLGTTLAGKWTLDRLIGVGGMAAVYAASHRNGAVAAIKLLHAAFARIPEARTRFMREGYIANVAGPGAVRVLDDDVDDDGAPFLVMELLDGETIDVRVDREGGTMPILHVLWLASETLATLEVAHAAGVIHRDLKPANLFWTKDDAIKLLDFGIARLDRETGERTMAGTVMGTLGYMAHEQAAGRPEDVDARTDVWAVGAIMFTLLSGRNVHLPGGMNELIVAATQRAASLANVAPTLPREIAAIVDRALEFEMADRYPSARAMREDILRVASEDDLRAAVSPNAGARQVMAAVAPVSQPASRPPVASSQPRPSLPPEGFATGMSDEDTLALRGLFELLELALLSRAELEARGGEKALAAARVPSFRRLENAFKHAERALATAHIGLFWNVLPDGFATKQGLLWVARAPLPPTPATMFDGGVRTLGLLPGLTFDEFGEVVRMLHGDLTPFHDYATFLQASEMPHVVFRIDPTRPGMPEHPSISVESTMSGQTNVLAMLQALEAGDPALRAVLVKRLERVARGHEAEIGGLLPTAGAPLAMSLLRVLAAVSSPAAREALARGAENPSAVVRIETLARSGAGEDAVRAEIDRSLAAAGAAGRVELLVALETYRVVTAAPTLALRVKSPAFDASPEDERRQIFATLAALLPARAESLATALVKDQRVISTDAHEATREIACNVLGRIGRSRDARDALLLAVKNKKRTRERVWLAASLALESVEARYGGLP